MRPERLYSALLMLYPKAFRQEYGETMAETFREFRGETNLAPFRFWLFVLGDASRSACREHITAWRSGTKRFALQWVLACALGAVATGALGSALSWSFSYLYHPYLEGLTFIPWSYGALLGLGLGAVQSAAIRHRLRLGAAWILVSAACAAAGLQMAVMVAHVAGPLGCGVVLGLVVASGQWLVVRTQVQRAGWWVVASAVALSGGVLSCGLAVNGALRGMNPLPDDLLALHTPSSYGPRLDWLVRGLYGPTTWAELAVGFAVTATTGLVIGAITARPLSSMLSRAR